MTQRILGKPTTTQSGLLNIHDADFHKFTLVRHFMNYTGVFGALESAANPGDWQLTLTAGTIGNFSIADRILLSQDETEELDQHRITNKAGQVLSLNRPITNSYDAGLSKTIEKVKVNLAEANLTDTASVAAPVIFKLKPPKKLIFHLRTVNIQIEHAAEPTDALFGSIPVLSNGIWIYEEKKKTEHVGIFRNNGDFKEYFGATRVIYTDKAGPSTWATSIELNLKDLSGTISNLIGELGDGESLNINVQDNLEALSEMEAIGIGHIEED
jgi:hypothetical protein